MLEIQKSQLGCSLLPHRVGLSVRASASQSIDIDFSPISSGDKDYNKNFYIQLSCSVLTSRGNVGGI